MPRQRLLAITLILALTSTGFCASLSAAEATIAVASNFSQTMAVLVERFEESTPHRLRVVLGSSGKLFAQISNGAPFDVFLSADAMKPALLEEQGLGVSGSRKTFAIGRLALWGNSSVIPVGAESFLNSGVSTVAIANPRLAPYGLAGEQVLGALGLLENPPFTIVQGENIAQTYQFVYTGNADIGLVSLAQLYAPDTEATGSYWPVPTELHEPIVQDLVILQAGEANAAALAFIEFLNDPLAIEVIESFGYLTTFAKDEKGR